MDIHQVLVSVAYGDAVTNEALQLRALLREHGRSEIFAMYVDHRLPDVRPLTDFERVAKAGSAIVAQYSIGNPMVNDFLVNTSGPLVVRYHNVTPPHFFAPLDPEFAEHLESGRRDLRRLAARAAAGLAVSEFNAVDLREAGFARVEVAPYVADYEHLVGIRAEPVRQASSAGPVIAFVGRISPNKRHDLLIQAFHVLKTYLQPAAQLWLVGSFYSPLYRNLLDRLLAELAIPGVTFTDHVTTAQLAWVYRQAAAFCCLSEHEGFGVPLIEAMAFGVPVVAWGVAAVPETVAGAGLLLPEARPTLAAEALNAILSDTRLRDTLTRKGGERSRELGAGVTGPRLRDGVLQAIA